MAVAALLATLAAPSPVSAQGVGPARSMFSTPAGSPLMSSRPAEVRQAIRPIRLAWEPFASEVRLNTPAVKLVAWFTLIPAAEDILSSKFTSRADPVSVMELLLTAGAQRGVKIGIESLF